MKRPVVNLCPVGPVHVLCQFLIAEHQKLKLGIIDVTLPGLSAEGLRSKGST